MAYTQAQQNAFVSAWKAAANAGYGPQNKPSNETANSFLASAGRDHGVDLSSQYQPTSTPTPDSGLGLSIRDWGKQNNVGIGYDPTTKRTIIDGISYDPDSIPGTKNVNGYNYITDQSAWDRIAGVDKKQPVAEVPKVEVPKVEIPKFEMPDISGYWNQFMTNFAPAAPVAQTQDLSSYVESTRSKLEPVLATQIANLNAQRKQAQENTENDLKRRGFFGQLPSMEKMNELNSEYDNSEANLRANFLQNVMGQAFPLYSQSMAQDQASQSAYDQNMLNLGLAVMNGMIDQNQFIADDAYRKAVLARLYGQDAAAMFGTIGGE